MRIARIRKAIVAALGMAVTLVLLVPEEALPEQWRPVVGIVLALGTIAGVYKVRNDQRPTRRADLRQRLQFDRPKPAEPTTYGRRGKDDLEGPPRRHVRGDRPPGRGEDPPGSVP